MDRCPVCRAALSTPQCQRCGSNWASSQKIHDEADALQHQAINLLASGDTIEAQQTIAQALRMKRTPFGLSLSNFIAQIESQKPAPEKTHTSFRSHPVFSWLNERLLELKRK